MKNRKEKILILNPPFVDNFCRSARWAAKSRGRVQRHPEKLLILVGILEKAGHTVCFVDGAVLNLTMKDVEKEIDKFVPDLVVIHTTTPSIYSDISYAKLIKDRVNAFIILVGAHVTSEIEDTFRIAGRSVDAIARGEYDFTIKDLAGKRNLKEIKGISFVDRGAIVHVPERDLLDVKELPFPSWKHIKPEWYFDAGKRSPFLTLISSRGCLGRCTFCRDAALMSERKLRFRPAKSVVDEIEYDYKLFPYLKEIMFEDDTFTASAEHVRAICEEILRRKLRVCWSCNARADMDLSLLPLMKKAGCRMLMTGFEFGTQEALNAVKKDIFLVQSKKFAERAHNLRFIIHGCFMFGAPGETRESCRKTIDFAKSLPLDTIQFSGVCPYPGTELYNWAKNKGYLIPKDWMEWVDENHEQTTLLSYPNLSNKEIDGFINIGLKEFYFRRQQIFRMIFNIRSIGDVKRKIFGFKNFLKMLKAHVTNSHDKYALLVKQG